MGIAKYLPLLVLVALSGCGTDIPNTKKVTGEVTYNGEPVEDAMVSFGATEGTPSAGGRTDAAGEFTLTTFEEGDGAVPGTYAVAISKVETEGGMTEEEEHAAIEEGQPINEAGEVNRLPAKYRSGERSGLTATVTEDGENHFEFDLTD